MFKIAFYSPVMVRMLRAITPRSVSSWARRQRGGEFGSSRNRIFKLVRSGYNEVSKDIIPEDIHNILYLQKDLLNDK